jgi:hypothetical protein
LFGEPVHRYLTVRNTCTAMLSNHSRGVGFRV